MSNTRDQNPRENAVLRGLRGPASRATLAARFQALCDQLRRESATPALFQTPSRETIEKQRYRLETGKTEYPQELFRRHLERDLGNAGRGALRTVRESWGRQEV